MIDFHNYEFATTQQYGGEHMWTVVTLNNNLTCLEFGLGMWA